MGDNNRVHTNEMGEVIEPYSLFKLVKGSSTTTFHARVGMYIRDNSLEGEYVKNVERKAQFDFILCQIE